MLKEEIDSLTPSRDFSRRSFVQTTVGSGFAAAVLPVTAQTITTDTAGLEAGSVDIPVGDFQMPAYRAAPAGRKNLPVVLVASEIFGVHEHIADVCRRFAKQGYLAIAPELFARHGNAGAYADIPKLISEVVSKASDAQVNGDLDAAVAWAAAHGGDTGKLGITGFCWGGRAVWSYAAHNPRLTAAVAWYGPVARSYHAGDKTVIERAASIKAPVLALYGAADGGIPVETLTQLEAALKAAGNTRCEFVVYPDTPHAFHADYRPSYRKAAAEDGWARCLAWFRTHGVA
ncbi:dienelactone hydrolase family protein [Roseateles sp.]|uniref:dienelactone hydrolase family protein n=1 Tax=Roseateles sp. TaxID=1971397 RepID=UPI0025CEC83F|nr:dienelactone hydrolase family protein [Roseateles sp.]MBV8034486.1 dienelactone hydrolase family protein [Roseateles sp.]